MEAYFGFTKLSSSAMTDAMPQSASPRKRLSRRASWGAGSPGPVAGTVMIPLFITQTAKTDSKVNNDNPESRTQGFFSIIE